MLKNKNERPVFKRSNIEEYNRKNREMQELDELYHARYRKYLNEDNKIKRTVNKQ